ncbi:MAG: glycosyltransferase family 4 protein [Methylococcales bacterium]
MRRLRILTFTTLYPNNIQKRHGIFVEQRVRKLLALGGLECRVIAPVPWFPFHSERFGRYAQFAGIDAQEERFGIPIDHPRYPVIPKIGMTIAPFLLALFAYPAISKLFSEGYDFDLIDAHYYYPDGVAAVLLAKWLNKPLVITARGTDINLVPDYFLPRKIILWAAEKADRSITVCRALKDEMIRLGAEADKIHVFRNGVDLDFFKPVERISIRKKLGIDRPCLLSVGHLIERKGHHLVIEALQDLPDFQLLIAGDGEELRNLKNLVEKIVLANRVIFLGALSHPQLGEYYSAVDALVLASSREGWANVLLESMACGTPVVATRIWGTPEVVTSPEAGILIDERTAQSIAAGVRKLMLNPPSREMTREYAENFSWESSVRGIEKTFRAVLDARNRV